MTEKIVHNQIRNALRSITEDCTLPQKKAVKDLLLGILREGTTVVNHLANEKKTVKVGKQAERLRRHLESVDLVIEVEKRVMRTLPNMEDDDIIAYDLSDIAKPSAKKMEGLSEVFDGSERKPTTGYTLHGVSISNQPVVMEIHDHDAHTLNQTRLTVIDRIIKKTETNGIWVFDRGNDDQQFFGDLAKRKLRFVVRLRSNRHLINCATGEILSVEDFLPGIYEVLIPKTKQSLTLVVEKQHPKLQPIRVLTNIRQQKAEEVILWYLKRWEVENLFKQMKTKYLLESIRVLSLKKLKNLLALVQLATSISNTMFDLLENEETDETLSAMFSHYCAYRSLSRNAFSFSRFLASVVPEINTPPARPKEPSLFSWRQMGKLGVF